MWNITYSKQPKQPGKFVAVEGELEDRGEGWTTFKFMMFEARSLKYTLKGRATKKAKLEGFAKFLAMLREQGYVKPKEAAA